MRRRDEELSNRRKTKNGWLGWATRIQEIEDPEWAAKRTGKRVGRPVVTGKISLKRLARLVS